MPSKSATTLRVTGIRLGVQEQQFADAARDLVASVSAKPWSLDTRRPCISLASQYREKVGTISFPSTELKNKALKHLQRVEWGFGKPDDDFSNMTVLHSPEDPDLE